MPRVLRTDVYVAGRRFLAGSTPPDAYARRITNPQAWQDGGDFLVDRLIDQDPELIEVLDVTGPVPNSNDTSQAGDNTNVVALEPTGVTGGPEPRPGPSTGANTAGAGPAPEPEPAPRLNAPPRSGKGSGTDAWEAFARVHGVALTEGFDRGDIIAACEAAGLVDPA
ncbi:MAG: hypothetical protein ABWY93_18825 [Mycobacterium sp.]